MTRASAGSGPGQVADGTRPDGVAGGIVLSTCVIAADGRRTGEREPDLLLSTASVGKILLLLEVAAQIAEQRLDPAEPLTRSRGDHVADSGLWHTLRIQTLPLADVAALVGAVSDNLATNVLLRRVGLPAVTERADALGLTRTGLHDRVRDVRTPKDPERLSSGTAAELAGLMHRIAAGRAAGSQADALVRDWLSAGTDLSMTADAAVLAGRLDPLVRRAGLFTKTGTDAGVRADVGAVDTGEGWVAWAAIAGWDPTLGDRAAEAMTALRGFGRALPI